MFKLVKILGGRTNCAEPRRVHVSSGPSKALTVGMPISIANGTATVVDGDRELHVTHLIDQDCKANAKDLTVIDVLPGMVFSSFMMNDLENYAIGGEYIIENGAVTSDPVSQRGAGAVVFDIPEQVEGGEILVTFRAN